MDKKTKQDRQIDLITKATFGDLTIKEHKELDRLSEYLENPATDAQVEYIEVLLDKLGADLDDYTDVTIDWLTNTEASELIDQLKDEVTDAGAWEN